MVKATKPEITEGANGDYATRVELIEFEGKKNPHIRFAYWRRPAEKKGEKDWTWASQTTWVFSVERTTRAIREAENMGLFLQRRNE